MIREMLHKLLLFGHLLCASALQFCPKECICSGAVVNCANRGLKYVPKLPSDAERIDLQKNHIARIERGSFDALSQLRVLQLDSNQLQQIDKGAFNELVRLQRLRLSNNHLRTLPDNLLEVCAQLERLDLSHNHLTVLSNAMLRGLDNLRNLQVDHNSLVCVDVEGIERQRQLEILTLNNNNLTTLGDVNFARMRRLRTLRLHDNRFVCDCRLSWLAAYLRRAPAFANNVRCAAPTHLVGRSLETLNERAMRCSGIERRALSSCVHIAICPPMCTCSQNTVDCRGRGLTQVPTHLPEGTHELRLEQNDITFIPSDAFADLQLLRRLDLSNNRIENISANAFRGLRHLSSLVLYGNRLKELRADMFEGLHTLQLLLLNANHIECIRTDAFHALSQLNLLSLYDNRIQSIANGTFASMKQLQTLHLAHNPLICDCNMRWLGDWLQAHPIETSGARCQAPRRVRGQRLTQPHLYTCKDSEIQRTLHAGNCFIDHECPDNCTCSGTTVDCSARLLIHMPANVPQYTTRLLLNDNRIRNINSSIIASLPNLHHLNLSGNLLQQFDDDTFAHASTLRVLDLSRNQLVFVNSRHLTGLPHLEELKLHHNELRCIADGTFDNLKTLTSITLHENALVCNCQLLSLSDVVIDRPELFARMPVCTGADERQYTLDNMPPMRCTRDMALSSCTKDGRYCPASCTCDQSIVRCSGRALRSWPNDVPSDTSELYLDNNAISVIDVSQLSRLTNLKKLDLSNNAIRHLAADTFANLTQLSTLILSFNKLQCVDEYALRGLIHLKILSLHGNDISRLPETAFADLNNITHIALGSNPLLCDCDLRWISAWIKRDYIEPGIARCYAPTSMHQQLVLTAPLDAFEYILCDACAASPCQNGASCATNMSAEPSYTCTCAPGYHGQRCERAIDACYGQPCFNDATCVVQEAGRFICKCAKGFAGARCEINIDDCIGNECKNNGTCVDKIADYECLCPAGYTGWDCGKELDYCASGVNPCANGATCRPMERDYECVCANGYSGRNCTENIDDCQHQLCRNGGVCVDAVDGYVCSCRDGYTGRHCELPPVSNELYPRTAACQQSACQNGGYCNEEDDEVSQSACTCPVGYSGDRCERVHTFSFDSSDSYVALEPWNVQPEGNITLTLVTAAKSGVLLYYGSPDGPYCTVELFNGHIKVAYLIGNDPPSYVYSYVRVDDNRPHTLQIVSRGQQITMQVDHNRKRRVSNDGDITKFEVVGKQLLYLGGVPETLRQVVLSNYQLRDGISYIGCLMSVHVNEQLVDLTSAVEKHGVKEGCGSVLDPCRDNKACGANGRCIPSRDKRSFKCECAPHYQGERCEQRTSWCKKRKRRDYYRDVNGCRTVRPMKNATCHGECSADGVCCRPSIIKRRKRRFICPNRQRVTKEIEVVRKCDCQTAPTCEANERQRRWWRSDYDR